MTSVSNKRLVVSFSHWLLRCIPCHTIWYQGYDAVPACEKTGSCHCLLCALSTLHSDWINLAYAVCDVHWQTRIHINVNIHFFITLLTYDIYLSKHAFPITILQSIIESIINQSINQFFKICANVQKALHSGGLRPLHPLWGCAPEPHWGLPSSGLRTTWLVSVSLSKGNSPHKIKLEFPPPKFDETEEPVARIHAWMTLTKFWSRFAFTVYVANVQKALLSGGLRPLHPFPPPENH